MSTPDGDDPGRNQEVLSSLPRSRRQRATAGRQAARARRGTKNEPEASGKASRARKAGTKATAGRKAGTDSKSGATVRAANSAAKKTAPKAVTGSAATAKPDAKTTGRARMTAKTTADAKRGAKTPLTPPSKRAADLPRVRPPRRAIPPAGYATPTGRSVRGSADPTVALGRLAEAGASAIRGVLRRLPL